MGRPEQQKRRRDEEEDDPMAALLKASEEYVPYVPLKQRRKGVPAVEEEERRPAAAGREEEEASDQESPKRRRGSEEEEEEQEEEGGAGDGKRSLLDVQEEMRKIKDAMDPKLVKMQQQKRDEQRILAEVSASNGEGFRGGRARFCFQHTRGRALLDHVALTCRRVCVVQTGQPSSNQRSAIGVGEGAWRAVHGESQDGLGTALTHPQHDRGRL
jgi:hypothetical protein